MGAGYAAQRDGKLGWCPGHSSDVRILGFLSMPGADRDSPRG
jgi:hypothetical protein